VAQYWLADFEDDIAEDILGYYYIFGSRLYGTFFFFFQKSKYPKVNRCARNLELITWTLHRFAEIFGQNLPGLF